MKNKYRKKFILLYFCLFFLLIFDSTTAITAAVSSISVCLQSVIPSLFPFFLLSGIISREISGMQSHRFDKFCKFLGIPAGSESLFFLGLLSGYPVGAQNVVNAYTNSGLPINSAKRMLGFCNNAGPAFIFGILGPMFHSKTTPFFLWGIHTFSAIFVATILPGKDSHPICFQDSRPISFSTTMERSLKSIATVCGWVIIFRVLIAFVDKWLLCKLPSFLSILLCGLLELTNGCILLPELQPQGLRFILCALLLSAGGLCVTMQTISVTKEMGLGMYFPGKAFQTAISVLMATILQLFIFNGSEKYAHWFVPFVLSLITIIYLLIALNSKLGIAFRKKSLYNVENPS